MDPLLPIPPIQSVPTMQPIGGLAFLPGVFVNAQDSSDYLSSLDSDTRYYVTQHMNEFRSRQDIEDFVHELHKGS